MIDNTFVESFHLHRRENTGSGYGAGQDLLAQDRSATSYDDYRLTPGASYQYRVRACNARRCSMYGHQQGGGRPLAAAAGHPEVTASAMGTYMHVAWAT